MTRLPDADTSFFYAALHQLDPAVRPIFTARVAAIIDTLQILAPATSTARSVLLWPACGRRHRTSSGSSKDAGRAGAAT